MSRPLEQRLEVLQSVSTSDTSLLSGVVAERWPTLDLMLTADADGPIEDVDEHMLTTVGATLSVRDEPMHRSVAPNDKVVCSVLSLMFWPNAAEAFLGIDISTAPAWSKKNSREKPALALTGPVSNSIQAVGNCVPNPCRKFYSFLLNSLLDGNTVACYSIRQSYRR